MSACDICHECHLVLEYCPACLEAVERRAAEAERAKVVAMLRRQAKHNTERDNPIPKGLLSEWMIDVAESLEAGELWSLPRAAALPAAQRVRRRELRG
jgi:hypothetical protein